MATRHNIIFPNPDSLPFPAQAVSEYLSGSIPVDKKRTPLGLIEVDTYPPNELTGRLVFSSLMSDSTRHVVTANAQFYVMAERVHRFRK